MSGTRIGILGATGSMGSALAAHWARAGHRLCLGYSRQPDRLRTLARQLGPGHAAGTVAEAVDWGDLILLAAGWPQVEGLLEECGSGTAGKVLVDCTNPFNSDHSELAPGLQGSGGELVASWAPRASVVKAFNTIFARVLVPGSAWEFALPPTVPLSGDEDAAKERVAGLVRDCGLLPVDTGPLRRCRASEELALVMTTVWQRTGEMLGVRLEAATEKIGAAT